MPKYTNNVVASISPPTHRLRGHASWLLDQPQTLEEMCEEAFLQAFLEGFSFEV